MILFAEIFFEAKTHRNSEKQLYLTTLYLGFFRKLYNNGVPFHKIASAVYSNNLN